MLTFAYGWVVVFVFVVFLLFLSPILFDRIYREWVIYPSIRTYIHCSASYHDDILLYIVQSFLSDHNDLHQVLMMNLVRVVSIALIRFVYLYFHPVFSLAPLWQCSLPCWIDKYRYANDIYPFSLSSPCEYSLVSHCQSLLISFHHSTILTIDFN